MAGWVCVPLDIKWKRDELKDRLAISKPDIIVAEQYRLSDISCEEGRIIEIEEWKEMIENYLPAYHSVENVQNAPFYMGFTSGSTGKAKAFLRAQQSWVHSFDCNVHDFHMKKDRFYFNSWDACSFSFLIRSNKCIVFRANGTHNEKVCTSSSAI